MEVDYKVENDGSQYDSHESTMQWVPDEEEIFRCDMCSEVFSHESTFRRHQKDHEASKCRGLNNEEYICYSCDKLFYYLRLYKAHMLKFHSTNVDVPSTNSPITDLHNGAEENIPKKTSKQERINETYKCDYCDRQFDSKNDIILHLDTHNKDLRLVKTKQPSKKLLPKKRIVSTHPRRPVVSPNFMNEEPISSRETAGTKGVQLSYQISNSNTCVGGNNQGQSSSAEVIDLDSIEENDTMRFSCTKCDKKFYLENSLLVHLAGHEKTRQIHFCTLCDYCSEIQFSFALHVLDHYKKNYKCYGCDRSFYTKETRDRHAEIHFLS